LLFEVIELLLFEVIELLLFEVIELLLVKYKKQVSRNYSEIFICIIKIKLQ